MLDDVDYCYPNELGGYRLRVDEYEPRGYPRLQIRCLVHKDCSKYRGLGAAQCRHFGPREPLAYLMVWALCRTLKNGWKIIHHNLLLVLASLCGCDVVEGAIYAGLAQWLSP